MKNLFKMRTVHKHIKTLLLILVLFFVAENLIAQNKKMDTIHTIDGKEIVAKVLEIGEEFVIYQTPDLEGVDLSIKIGRVDRIEKSDGEVIAIREVAEELEEPQIKFKSNSAEQEMSGRSYWLIAKVVNVDDKESIKLRINDREIDTNDFLFEKQLLFVATDEIKRGENAVEVVVDYFGENISKQSYFAYAKKSSNTIRLGLKGGVILNNYNFLVNGENANGNVDGKLGAALGLQIEKPISSNFIARLEGLYTQRGYESSVYDATLSTNYLELALLGVVKFSADAKISPFVSVGPSASFMIGSGTAMVNEAEVEVTFEKQDFGLSAGFGLYINNNILVEARYIHGLTNIESARDVELVNEETRTQNLIIGLSYFFVL